MTPSLSWHNLTPKIRDEMWRRGILHPKLRPEQQQMKAHIESASTQLFVGNISRRWGKSFTLVLYAIEQALRTAQRIRYGAAFQTDLTEFILPAFHIILEDCPAHLRPTYHESKKKWLFPNGSEIGLVGLDKKPNGLRGNAIAKIIVDEAAFVAKLEYIYTSVIIPATAKQKDIKVVFLSTPPESPEHFFVDLIGRAKAEGCYATFTIDDISDLTPEEKLRLITETGGPDSVTTKREWYGQIVADEERAVCPTFNKAQHIAMFDMPKYAHWTTAVDTGGVNDMTVALLLAYDYENRRVLICDERVAPPRTVTPTWLADVRAMEEAVCPAGTTPPSRVVDASGQLLIDLAGMGFACCLPRKDEFHASLAMLRTAFYRGEVVIHERCRHLIGALESCLLTPNRTDYLRSKTYGHADAIAALIYGLRHVRKDNPVPLHAMGISAHTHFIPPVTDTFEGQLGAAFSTARFARR